MFVSGFSSSLLIPTTYLLIQRFFVTWNIYMRLNSSICRLKLDKSYRFTAYHKTNKFNLIKYRNQGSRMTSQYHHIHIAFWQTPLHTVKKTDLWTSVRHTYISKNYPFWHIFHELSISCGNPRVFLGWRMDSGMVRMTHGQYTHRIGNKKTRDASSCICH